MKIQTVTASSLTNTQELRALFTGRTNELIWVQETFKENRLAAITGPYGSGKTVLAIVAGEEIKSQFAGGVKILCAEPGQRITDLLAAAFPIIPRQSALLIMVELPPAGRTGARH